MLFGHYIGVLRDYYDIDPLVIVAARKKVESSKGSFDLVGYLLESGTLNQAELEQVGEEFIKRSAADPAVLMPGAEKFLQYLQLYYAGKFSIMTFGNPDWQRLKIAAVGLDTMKCLIVDSSRKARQIASWYDEASSGYVLPDALLDGSRVVIQEIILVDDKPVAFKDLHEKTRGYLVNGDLKGDVDLVGGRVTVVNNLEDVIDCEVKRGFPTP